jgi:polar amino acid transport system substrate-binding protein
MRPTALRLACVLSLACIAPVQSAPDDHAGAVAALADVRAAVAEIVRIEDGYAVGHAAYLRAAHRAMNALVGRRDDGYAGAYGDPGDGVGALGHLDAMLDQTRSWLWTPAIEGAKANVLAASDNLQSALGDKEMEDYEADLTRTLASLALVVGRSSQDGVLGGISGALGTTSLAVPAGVASVSGCALPSRAPAYGVVSQRLVYVALPRHSASATIPDDLSIGRVVVQGDDVILYTRGSATATTACGRTAHLRQTGHLQRTRDVVVAVTMPEPPFTAAQAHDGAAVYKKSCIQCHGADLQGTAGPSVAGTDFLTTAKGNKWTLSDLRTTVFQNMPFSDPGSLTPKQYAAVTAFLLASNCYPAGPKPFPVADSSALAAIKIAAPAGAKATNAKLGTCAVK